MSAAGPVTARKSRAGLRVSPPEEPRVLATRLSVPKEAPTEQPHGVNALLPDHQPLAHRPVAFWSDVPGGTWGRGGICLCPLGRPVTWQLAMEELGHLRGLPGGRGAKTKDLRGQRGRWGRGLGSVPGGDLGQNQAAATLVLRPSCGKKSGCVISQLNHRTKTQARRGQRCLPTPSASP